VLATYVSLIGYELWLLRRPLEATIL